MKVAARLWESLPRSVPRRIERAARWVAIGAPFGMVLLVVWPLLLSPWTLGQHDWDQMNTQREVVVKTIARFHQFPFWDPYTCGGRPTWGSLEGDPIVVSPWLPFYLLLPLPIAVHIEIVASAVLGVLGSYVLASRFTASTSLRALFAILTGVNSRWALQIAAGHTWHLLYGIFPWVLFFFDRALDPARPRPRRRLDLVLAAAAFALMAYGCAIYPVPHAAFALFVFSVVLARTRRSWAPIVAFVACGATAIGLAAPKLFPLAEALWRFPRLIKSDEAMWPQYLLGVFTWPIGDYTASAPFFVGMWHEWGLYIGWPALVASAAAIWASRGQRERALKWAGLLMLSFVVGGFHPLMPWSLLHLVPIFRSQHVPSRWLYPAVVVLACAGASGAEGWLRRAGARRAVLEVVLACAAVALAVEMGSVAGAPIAQSFVAPMPAVADLGQPFRIVHRLAAPAGYRRGPWDVATLPGVIEGVGTMECNTDNGLHITHRDAEGRMPGVGAYGDNDPEYRGEAYVAERAAQAEVVSWSPNVVEVHVEGAHPGDHVVLNQNWDPGWMVNGARAGSFRDAVAAVATGPSETFRFVCRPRTLWWGVLAWGLTVAGIAFLVERRAERLS